MSKPEMTTDLTISPIQEKHFIGDSGLKLGYNLCWTKRF